jgi:hypothetical protein
MYSSNYIERVWKHNTQFTEENKDAWVAQIEDSSKLYKNWKLVELDMDNILTYTNSSLENDYFVNLKVTEYLKLPTKTMPPVILKPIDRLNEKPFLEHKYKNINLKWEPLDGVHRLLTLSRLGIKTIWAYIPCEV